MCKILNSNFFRRSPDIVAKELVGKLICVQSGNTVNRYRNTETEAYFGTEKFCYGYGEKRLKLKSTVFYSVARLYHYYGMLMFSCNNSNCPDNVLIRGVEGCSGPVKVLNKLNVLKTENGAELTENNTVFLVNDGAAPKIAESTRTGINSVKKLNFKAKL